MTLHPSRRTVVTGLAAASAAAAFATPPAAAAQPREHIVEITEFAFASVNHAVAPGDTVTWINRDIAPHTATADDKSWDTGRINKGERKSIIVTPGMTRPYFCKFHPVMKSQI